MDEVLKIIPTLATIIAAFWALYLFNKQHNFKRLQNLSSLWKQFADNDTLLDLFNLMDQIEINPAEAQTLATTDSKIKLKYLALIEEVALYTENFEIDTEYAKYMFQWHFYYVYLSQHTTVLFWENLGGADEKNEDYWSKSRELAGKIKPNVN